MPEINGVSNVDNNVAYNSGSVKKSSGTSDFSSFLGESKNMNEIFEEAAQKYNIPVELLKAVGKAESNFNPKAVSRCGAQGVMQLMPATAKELGVKNSFDAEQNIMGGAKYIAGLLKKYDGNTSLALAAYNAGSGNVAKYDGIPPFTETQNYVKKVMNYYGKGNVEIASAENKKTNSSETNREQSKIATVATATPLQRNLSFILTGDSDNSLNGMDLMEDLFFYDDYMKFIELYLDDENKEEEIKEEESKEDKYTNDKYTNDKYTEENKSINNMNNTNYEINYNAAVMNLSGSVKHRIGGINETGIRSSN